MKKRILASLLTLVMLLGLLPTAVFAVEETPGDSTCICDVLCGNEGSNECPVCAEDPAQCTGEEDVIPEVVQTFVYVSDKGNDETGNGTQENPFATLTKAVENAQDGATICVLSNLEIKETVDITKSVKIIGAGDEKPVLTATEKGYSIFRITSKINVSAYNLSFSGKGVDNSNSYSRENNRDGKTVYGGAIVIGSSSTDVASQADGAVLTVENCDFSDLEAHQGGAIGVIFSDDVVLNVKNSTFSNNSADLSGGAICGSTNENLTLTIDGCSFSGNKATTSGASSITHGGAVAVDAWLTGGYIAVTKSTFKGNSDNGTSTLAGGGAFSISSGNNSGSSVNFEDCSFEENVSAVNGGAIFINSGETIKLLDCTFEGNKATKHGGAIHVGGGSLPSKITISGSTFAENTAGVQGGAINLGYGTVNTTMSSVLFQENTTDLPAGNAIIYFATGNATAKSMLYSTNGAVFYKNGNVADGINRDTLYVNNASSSDDTVFITDYMLDGTRANWKELDVDPDSSEYILVEANRADYGTIEGDQWKNGIELYLVDDENIPVTTNSNAYSNVFIRNHAKYGGAISNYGSLTIGSPGKDITVTKEWSGVESNTNLPAVTINLVRTSDNKVLESVALTAETNWTHTFSDFPADVEYTITENPVSGYTSTPTKDEAKSTDTTDVWIVTNTKYGGNGGTTYYTLHYESNGGTVYRDERHARNTTVTLDKVPVREGYQFTGWYADAALTEPISQIKMTSAQTVYAGWQVSTVPDWLNGDDHFAYIIGYSDGTVQPNANISRAEVATIFFRLLKGEIRDGNLTTSSPFADVKSGMWFNQAVSTMAALGIVNGRTVTDFEPYAPITRAEFSAICSRFDTGLTDGNSDFTDISGHWAEAEIQRAASLGWIQGYEDGTFRPDQSITRAEAMTIINRVLCRIPEKESDLLPGMNTWPDNPPGTWYYLAVQEATNSHSSNHKGEIYETWTDFTAAPDWTKYQT